MTTNHRQHRPPELPGTAPDSKLLPFDEFAERNVVGGILLDGGLLPAILATGLKAGDFYIVKYRWMFAAAVDLFNKGQDITVVTLASRLRDKEQLDDAGGTLELEQIELDTLSPYSASSYAQIVKDKANRRKALDLAGGVARLAHDQQAGDFEANLAKMLEAFQDLATPQNAITGWQLFTLADAYQERPPLAWVIHGLFSLPSLNIFYGSPGTLKSMLLAEALICAAAGMPWLEPLPGQRTKPFQTVSSPVLWVDFDNGKRRTHERFEAFARAHNLPASLPTLFYASMPTPWLDASDKTAVDALANLITRNGIKLVALDNLGTIAGGVDENSPAMIPVMSNLRRLTEDSGAAVVVIHHQRKSNGIKSRAGDSLRGHSCIEAALDLALLVEREEASDRVGVKSTKTRDVDVLPFSVEWTYEHKEASTELASARFFGVDSENGIAALHAAILTCAKAEPGLSQTKLMAAVKGRLPRATVHKTRAEILTMAENGQLLMAGNGSKNTRAYYPNCDYVDF